MIRWMVAALAGLTATAAHGESVRIVRDQAAVAGCDRLSEVRGSSLLGGAFGSGIGYDNMISEMQEKAAAANGNRLLLIDTHSGMTGARGIGEAYRCEAEERPAPPRRRR